MIRGRSTPSITASASPHQIDAGDDRVDVDVADDGVDVDPLAHQRGEVQFGQHPVHDLHRHDGDQRAQGFQILCEDVFAAPRQRLDTPAELGADEGHPRRSAIRGRRGFDGYHPGADGDSHHGITQEPSGVWHMRIVTTAA